MRPKKKILLVDDQVLHLDTLKYLLEIRFPYAVTCAQAADEALVYVRREDFDLILISMILPRLGKLDLTRSIKAIRPDTALAVFSDLPIDHVTLRDSLADAFMNAKVSNYPEFLEQIRCLVLRKRGPRKASAVAVAPAIVGCAL